MGEDFFLNNFSTSKNEIRTIRTDFGESRSYGSSIWDIFLVNKTSTCTRRDKWGNDTPMQGPLLNNDIHSHYKIYLFNVITQILAGKIINNLTIKASSYSIIIYFAIWNLFPEGNNEPLYVCD